MSNLILKYRDEHHKYIGKEVWRKYTAEGKLLNVTNPDTINFGGIDYTRSEVIAVRDFLTKLLRAK